MQPQAHVYLHDWKSDSMNGLYQPVRVLTPGLDCPMILGVVLQFDWLPTRNSHAMSAIHIPSETKNGSMTSDELQGSSQHGTRFQSDHAHSYKALQYSNLFVLAANRFCKDGSMGQKIATADTLSNLL